MTNPSEASVSAASPTQEQSPLAPLPINLDEERKRPSVPWIKNAINVIEKLAEALGHYYPEHEGNCIGENLISRDKEFNCICNLAARAVLADEALALVQRGTTSDGASGGESSVPVAVEG
jgi:hypothetical protein